MLNELAAIAVGSRPMSPSPWEAAADVVEAQLVGYFRFAPLTVQPENAVGTDVAAVAFESARFAVGVVAVGRFAALRFVACLPSPKRKIKWSLS